MAYLPSVNIIVLNWNGLHYLPSCLAALTSQEYPEATIYLIDNASSDNSLPYVREAFPQVQIIENAQNLGYAAGNNSGLKTATADISILVNPDIIVDKGWLQELIQVFAADERIGIAGCKLFYPGEGGLQHAGGFITHPQAIPGHHGLHEEAETFNTLKDVEYVIGAAIALRGSMLAKTGLLDEGFFMYFEDADLCQRARNAGYRVVFVPKATAVHDESALAVKGSPAYLKQFHSGRWRYLLKHFELQEILSKTFAAEKLWLARLSSQERLAADQAYRVTLISLPEIFAARERDGGTAVSPSDQEEIKKGLENLRRALLSRSVEPRSLADLSQNALVQERPFSSSLPVIGPIVAGIRSLWANIAVRPYVSALTRQQNQVNRAFIENVSEEVRLLASEEEVRLEQDEKRLAYRQTLHNLKDEVKHTYGRVFSLEKRLRDLEQNEIDRQK